MSVPKHWQFAFSSSGLSLQQVNKNCNCIVYCTPILHATKLTIVAKTSEKKCLKMRCVPHPRLPNHQRISRRSLEDNGGVTAVTDSGCSSATAAGQSLPPLAGLDLAHRGLGGLGVATATLKSSSPPGAESKRHQASKHLIHFDIDFARP